METQQAHEQRQVQFNHLLSSLTGEYVKVYTIVEHQRDQLQSYKTQVTEYKTQAHYWEAQFQKVKTKEQSLAAEVDELKAQLRKREQQLFGKKSEASISHSERSNNRKRKTAKKKRGQQAGSKGHGRRDYSHLPVVEETLVLDDATCPCCGLPYTELAGTEDSTVLEVINVSAYQRKIKRKRYKRCCDCPSNPEPQIICPPPTEKLIAKSKIGSSIWALLLLNKYEYQQPLYRTLKQLKGYGLSLAMGTIVDGLKKLLPLFIPLYDAIVAHNVASDHWHADETGWKVFESVPGKKNNRWFLWIFRNAESVVYKIDPTRSSKVLKRYFGEKHPGGILNVDRYSAYKVIAKSGLFVLAFCWAHVRRDFLEYAKAYPHNEQWGLAWVERINGLYHINNQRTSHEVGTALFVKQDKLLRKAVEEMKAMAEKDLAEPTLLCSAKKLLESLQIHWSGLTVFVERPDIPMDNNTAEGGLRPCVLGRKNYYGSGCVWSADLTAALFTLFETLKLWRVNLHTWLLAYFYECALLGGKPPDNIQRYLPWHMSKQQLELFAEPPQFENPD